jgi:hypothetical protein
MNLLASSNCLVGAGHSPHSDPSSTSSGDELDLRLLFAGPRGQFSPVSYTSGSLGDALLIDLFKGVDMPYILETDLMALRKVIMDRYMHRKH